MSRLLSNLAIYVAALLVFLIAVAFLAAPPAANAQGKAALRDAYCAEKNTASEREICRDKDLTRRDALLNEVYQELRNLLSKSDFKSLRKEQRAWLKQRNHCLSKTRCLANKYEDRVAELEQMIENLANPNKSHVEIGCDGPGQKFINGECISNAPKLSKKNRTCDKFGSITSKNSDTPVTVTFVNNTDSHRAVLWIDFKGSPVEYAALNAGQSFTIKTYLTHPWMFTDGPGNCIEMFMPQRGVSVFNITADSPFFGPEYD